MTGDEGDFWHAVREATRQLKAKHGIPCPECRRLQPKRDPTILLPGDRCRVDGYRDRRARLTKEQIGELAK